MAKRILVFCGGHIIAGVEVVTLAYLEALKDLGVEIYCITNAWGNGAFNERLKALAISYSCIKLGFIYPKNIRWTLDTLFHLPSAIKEIRKVIRSFKPDLCYHTSFRTVFMTGLFVKMKHIYHVHDYIEPTSFNKFILTGIQHKTTRFITVSDATAKSLMESGISAEKVSTLYNGTSILPEKQNIDNFEKLKIGIVGQIAIHKGHEMLLDALGELKKNNNIKFHLKVFGTGDINYIDKLKQNARNKDIESNIEWMGYKANLDEIYKDLNLLILPSIAFESFGMVIIEAGIRGILVLSTDNGGPAEIIEDKKTGYLFRSGDINHLKEKLLMIVNNPIDSKNCIKKSYLKISKDFNITIQAESLLKIIYN
ncbi:glycosyltransferase [Pedobacter sp. UBA5917]|jgi:glycosyltransferase involved in cell wall biosynthesis|uniref:glycosyltransferase n=1 Tax=Pedobacter sp. UBA5917 TaxID=1947061 RepID=UPI0025D27F50|nr:glycosyltransferase [Pedobacter sp. UBA5917]